MTPRLLKPLGIIAALGLAVAAARAAEEMVSSPAKRADVLLEGRGLLADRAANVTVKDPFHSQAFAETLASNSGKGISSANVDGSQRPVPGVKTGRELLHAIATSLKPSGFFVLGGEPTLVFGQKRVKAGSLLTITFEGTEYTLEIVSIERPNFTLRLNREEYTRPIK